MVFAGHCRWAMSEQKPFWPQSNIEWLVWTGFYFLLLFGVPEVLSHVSGGSEADRDALAGLFMFFWLPVNMALFFMALSFVQRYR